MSLGGGGAGRQQLQELSQQLQALDEEKEELEADVEDLESEKRDIEEAIEALDHIESGSTVQVPLGGGAYVRAEVENVEEVIVDLGADYAAERTEEGAVESLETKRDLVEDRIEEARSEIAEVEEESERVERQAQQAQQRMMQDQMRGQEQPDGE